jgi:hypothetical protein
MASDTLPRWASRVRIPSSAPRSATQSTVRAEPHIDPAGNTRQTAGVEDRVSHDAGTFIARRIRVIVFAAATLAVVLSVAMPAEARVLDRQRYSGSFAGHEVICGHRLHLEGTLSGVTMLKASHGDLPPRLLDNYDIHEVFTAADGDGYILDQSGLYSDVRVRHARGTLYRYTAINAGQVYTIRTLGGKAVYRNRGVFQITYLVDTQGDADFSNDVFLEDTLRLVKDAGKHPLVTSTDEEFCTVVEKAIGG